MENWNIYNWNLCYSQEVSSLNFYLISGDIISRIEPLDFTEFKCNLEIQLTQERQWYRAV